MKRILWVQRLRFIEVIIFFFKGLFSDISIRYDENFVSFLGKSLLILLKKFGLCTNYHPLILSGDKKDTTGCTLFYEIYKDMMTCIERFDKTYISNEPEWVKKMIVPYLLHWVENPFHFITMIKEEIFKLKDIEHEVYITGYPISSLVLKFYNAEGLKIKRTFSVRDFYPMIKPIYFFLIVILYQIACLKSKNNIEKIKPSVWVEYEGIRTMLSFWRDFVTPEKFDLIYYIDRPDTPISKETLNKCKQDDFKWIDLRKKHDARFSRKDIKEIILILFKYNINQPIWFNFFKLHYIILYRIFLSIYKHYKVKILIQHQNTSWIQQVQSMAMESAGGIMIGFHWSKVSASLPFFLTPEHVYFVWGKLMYSYLQKKGNTCRHILPCGLWILQDNIKKDIIIFNDYTNFIIAILDNSVASNIYFTPGTLSQFYLLVLTLIEKNPSWGGIIKSKNWNLDGLLFLPNGNEIVGKIKMLIKKKQIVFLDTNFSPVTASAYANLSVCYGLQTAGIVAGVHDYRVVIWDVAGWLKNPLYKDLEQQFLFDSLYELEQAIIKVSKGDKVIGDFSKWRQKLNYFDDFKAPERVGKFIQIFMDEVIKTDNMEHSLDFAVKRYIEENNIGEDFFKPEGWWDE